MDCKSMSIGEKRNRLLEMSSGQYVVFIDDDDNVPEYYIAEILKAIKTQPDCVSIKGIIKFEPIDNKPDRVFIHSLKYNKDTVVDGITVGKSPNHLNPIKREIAITVDFIKKSWAEDSDWAARVYPLLKTEVVIEKFMYAYFAYESKSQSVPNCTLSHI